jgi:hypothetical protein
MSCLIIEKNADNKTESLKIPKEKKILTKLELIFLKSELI